MPVELAAEVKDLLDRIAAFKKRIEEQKRRWQEEDRARERAKEKSNDH